MSNPNFASTPSNLPPRVPRAVIFKLIFFAIALAVLPISSYFLTVDRCFSGDTTYAGALAGLVANIIVGAYVIVAILEEDPNETAAATPDVTPSQVENKKDK